ncbi:MAG: transporter [bacterium]|uniref:Transporter n=1 Tax=Candidatus Methylomirabilis tolerans TaxID=3123416 RepID=A0AAJ1ETN5_9BACT|nr:transporter [Candidatus Methylomirabilis sp.]
MRQALRILLYGGVAVMLFGGAGRVWAGELGHYTPGSQSIRDYFVPEPGFYYVEYHSLYRAHTLKNRNGDEVKSITRTGPSGTTTVNADVDINVFVVTPTFIWASPWQVLGARYAVYIAPSFSDGSAQVSLSRTRSGGFPDSGVSTTLDADTGFGVGDLFVQPVWLGWSGKHYEVSAGYGFYAPTGKEGIGLEFWTNQFQLAGAWYPFEDRRTAVTLAGTYEIQSNMEDKDLTPGDRFSLNWGVSQYLPLTNDKRWLAELGVLGYSQWQVERDSGSDVQQIRNVQLNAKDEVHAAGIQVGLTFVPWKAGLTVQYQWEFGAEARFEGENLVVTLVKGF